LTDKELNKPPEKILIIRLSSIGDIILTTPVIRLLKQKFPNSTIDFVIKKHFTELLINHPAINFFYIFDKKQDSTSLKKIKQDIKNKEYDLIVDLHKNFRSFYLSFRTNAKKVVRYEKFALRRFLLVKFKLNFFKQIIPIYLRYLACLKTYKIQYDNQGLDIYFDEKTKQTIKEKYADFLTKSKSIVLGVVPGASFASKRWTPEGFQTVINYFIEQHQAKVILFGNASDRELIKSLNIKNSQAVLNTAGELSILETGAVMDYCDVVITNDSGLMHLASALEKKVVAIFGSTTEELGFFPSTTEHIVIENKNLKCRPCSHVGRDKCPKKHFKCMKEITSAEVINAVEQLLFK